MLSVPLFLDAMGSFLLDTSATTYCMLLLSRLLSRDSSLFCLSFASLSRARPWLSVTRL